MLAPKSHRSDHDEAFWAALADGKLLLQRCRSSGAFQYWPRSHSLATGKGGDIEWVESPGLGTIHTFSVVHRSFYDNLPAPYVLVIVDLDEDVRLLGHLVGGAEDDIEIGRRVRFCGGESADVGKILFEFANPAVG